jgi:hypothetical protein
MRGLRGRGVCRIVPALSAEEPPPPGGSFAFWRSPVREEHLHAIERGVRLSILWIILIVILVLALLGFFSRGYW